MWTTKRVDGREMCDTPNAAAHDLLNFSKGRRFATILADPPWQFVNKTGKVAPEHKRLSRYGTMKLDKIMALPVAELAASTSHLYLWCPNALLPEGLTVLTAWGFTYKANLVWHKIRSRQVNLLATRKREHSRKPDEQYEIIEACSPGPFLELFARGNRDGWATWGNQANDDYRPTWKTYAHHSRARVMASE